MPSAKGDTLENLSATSTISTGTSPAASCPVSAGWGYRRRVKRTALIKKINESSCKLVRPGARHDGYRHPGTRVYQPVPRHREIRDRLAKHILRSWVAAGRARFGNGINARDQLKS